MNNQQSYSNMMGTQFDENDQYNPQAVHPIQTLATTPAPQQSTMATEDYSAQGLVAPSNSISGVTGETSANALAAISPESSTNWAGALGALGGAAKSAGAQQAPIQLYGGLYNTGLYRGLMNPHTKKLF